MDIQTSIKKFILSLLCLAGLTGLVVFAVAYKIIHDLSYRTVDSPEYLKELEQHRSRLVKEYGAKKIKFMTKDEVTLAGLLIVRDDAPKTVVLCHGHLDNKEHMRFFINMFPHDNVLLFDFRAHGESDGELISIGCHEKEDVLAAVEFVKKDKNTKGKPIVGLGYSMGGAILLSAAAEIDDFKALILDSSFARLDQQISRAFVARTGMPRTLFMDATKALFESLSECSIEQINPVEWIKNVTCPVLIIHSEDDNFVSVADAFTLYKAAHTKKELWIVQEADHGHISRDNKDEYQRRVNEFFTNAI